MRVQHNLGKTVRKNNLLGLLSLFIMLIVMCTVVYNHM
jgi:hypothetical protein